MSENLKKFVELLSEADKEKVAKLATVAEVIAFAKEKGFALTAADIEPQDNMAELDLDDLEGVAGGVGNLTFNSRDSLIRVDAKVFNSAKLGASIVNGATIVKGSKIGTSIGATIVTGGKAMFE